MSRDHIARFALVFLIGCSVARAQSGSLTFSSATYSTSESAGSINITVVRTGGATGAVTVAFNTSDGTATAGADYTATNGTLAFADGQTNASFSVALMNDLLVETNETVNLILTNPTGGASLGSLSNAVLSIIDNDTPVIQFSAAAYSVSEDGTNAVIAVTRMGGTNVAVTVDFIATNGTATAGVDYTATNGSLTLDAGVISTNFSVAIFPDGMIGPDTTVSLLLSNATGGAVLGSPSNAVLRILDNGMPELQFTTNSFSQIEGAGSVTLTVTRLGKTVDEVTVDYATQEGTATNGSDYLDTTGTLVFAPGETQKSFAITILSDSLFESNETFSTALSNPTNLTNPALGAILGDPSSVTVTIINDDPQIVKFTDEDLDAVTATLTGHGTMEINFAGGGTNGSVDSIVLLDTDASSELKILVKKAGSGDGLLKIGSLTGEGALRVLDARSCDITNAINLSGDFPDLRSIVTLHAIGDNTTISFSNDVEKLTAATIGVCEIVAPRIGSLLVKGDKAHSIAGDFMATVTNTTMLGRLFVAGAISNATVSVPNGNIGSVRAAGMFHSKIMAGFTPTFTNMPFRSGMFIPDLRIGSVSVHDSDKPFLDSVLIADKVGRVMLRSVETNNNSMAFGVFARTSIGSVTIGAPKFHWKRGIATDVSLSDFHVKQ
jgi:hypothetical protein